MVLAVHLCRGNFKSTWAAQGSYEPVAQALLTEMNVDAYFLEYDDARSGDFKPLRFLPKGKTVVLGLVTTKLGELENKDDLKRRIDEAAEVRAARSAGLEPAVRLFQHRARQQHRRGGAARQAAAGGGDRGRGLEGLAPACSLPPPWVRRRGLTSRRCGADASQPFDTADCWRHPHESPDPPCRGAMCRHDRRFPRWRRT